MSKVVVDYGTEIVVGEHYNVDLTYNKVAGWRLWYTPIGATQPMLVAGQFDSPTIKTIEIDGVLIDLQEPKELTPTAKILGSKLEFTEYQKVIIKKLVKDKMKELMSCVQRIKKGETLEFGKEEYEQNMEELAVIDIQLDK